MGSVYDEFSHRDGPNILKKVGADSSVQFKELMTPEQWSRYSDRSPNGFIKLAIMDMGTNSIVWLASNRFTGEKVALRQLPSLENPLAKNEMLFYSKVFNHTGMLDLKPTSNPKLTQLPGIPHIIQLHEKIDDSKDIGFSYELGKKPLSEWLF